MTLNGLREINEMLDPKDRRADVEAFLRQNPDPVPGTVVFLSRETVKFIYVKEAQ